MKRIGVLICALLITMISSAQGKQLNTIILIGNSFNDDITISIGGVINNNYVSTIEFHKWFTRVEDNLKMWGITYGIIGIKTNSSIGILKMGGVFMKTNIYSLESITNKFNWGAEYLFISGEDISILYGLSFMKHSGINLKIGLMF